MEINHELLNEKSGIYCIYNVVNNKEYVGSSKNLYDRIHLHFHKLRNNKHSSSHLQNAYNKYGGENFKFKLLEFCNPEIRLIREQYFIDLLKPQYNKSLNVVGNLNSTVSEEQKVKISNTLKEKYKSGEIEAYNQNHKWFTIYSYDIFNLELHKTYKNIKDFKTDVGYGNLGYVALSKSIVKKQFIITDYLIESKEELLLLLKDKFLKCLQKKKHTYQEIIEILPN